jgi:1,4-dihydroxy-2-naphthoate octaprenyltransferase
MHSSHRARPLARAARASPSSHRMPSGAAAQRSRTVPPRISRTTAAAAGDNNINIGIGSGTAPRPRPEPAPPSGSPLQEHHQQEAAALLPDGTPAPKGPTPASKRALWLAAIKPPMYSVGLVPVAVAAAAVPLLHPSAAGAVATAVTAPALKLAAAAAAIIAWLNLSNDGFDAATGVDTTGMGKPESVVALTGGRAWPVLLLSLAFLAGGGALLAQEVGRASAAPGAAAAASAMLAAAVACGYVYQGPPFRLSYKGLGEPLCFVAFGPLATAAFYLTLAPKGALDAAAAAAASSSSSPALAAVAAVPATIWALSLLVGASTTVILFCSHFHQTQGDRAVGKMSPLVKLGTSRGVSVLRGAVAATYACAALACIAGMLPPLAVALASAVSLRASRRTVAFAEANHETALLVAPLKRYATAWHVAWGGGLAAGLALAATVAARRGGGALLLGGA